MAVFVAVQAGAGNFPKEIRSGTLRACKAAVKAALDKKKTNADGATNCTAAGDMVTSQQQQVWPRSGANHEGVFVDLPAVCTAALARLEDDPLTNAGTGSNLTSAQTVECDAALMESDFMQFTAVGSLSLARNPSKVVHELLCIQIEPDQVWADQVHSNFKSHEPSSSLMPPCLLVGAGADKFAKDCGCELVSSNTELITTRAVNDYEWSKSRLAATSTVTDGVSTTEHLLLDTVGAIAVGERLNASATTRRVDMAADAKSYVSCAGVSSGGLLLKHPGRIGHGPIFGAGVWAEQAYVKGTNGNCVVAVSTSGCGEYLARCQLAQAIGQSLLKCCLSANDEQEFSPSETVSSVFEERFLRANCMRYCDARHKLAGALCLVKSELVSELIWVHNTPGMCLAYSVDGRKVETVYSELGGDRLERTSATTDRFVVQGVPLKL